MPVFPFSPRQQRGSDIFCFEVFLSFLCPFQGMRPPMSMLRYLLKMKSNLKTQTLHLLL